MRDRREEILDRLEFLISQVPGVMKWGRNIEDVSGGINYRPAIILHDGTEEGLEWANKPRGSIAELMSLKPEIIILWGDKAALVATKVNELRRNLIHLIWTDSELRGMLGASQDCDIHLSGSGLETYQGESREARMLISFEFIYLLAAKELV